MGLLKGNLTFARYRVAGDPPAPFLQVVDGQLKKYAFQEMGAGAEETSLGWTSLENVLDTNFERANYSIGDYLAFCLRIDRKALSSPFLKLKIMEAERKQLKASGRKFLPRNVRENIRESLRLDLLARVFPVPSFYEVLWASSQKWLLFGSLSEKVFQEFEDLFKISFKLSLKTDPPWDPERLDAPVSSQVASLSRGFLRTKEAGGPAQDPSFLGREFLTWLWFKSEERSGMISLPGGDDPELEFLRRIVLESGEGEYSETVVCQGLHANLREGKAALREGKKIREARLRLKRGSEEWEFTFKADAYAFQSMKPPSMMGAGEEEEGDREGRLLERLYAIEKAVKTMDELFAFFLKRRLSPHWASEEIPRLKKWLSL